MTSGLATVQTASILGCEATPVRVEVQTSDVGQRVFRIVGLGDSAVQESRERIVAALASTGYRLPKRVIVNLAPADERKEGALFDLPIALGILCSIKRRVVSHKHCVVGELSLDGRIQPARATIPHALHAAEASCDFFVGPKLPSQLRPLLGDMTLLGIEDLSSALRVFLDPESAPVRELGTTMEVGVQQHSDLEPFEGVIGQPAAKRALIIAACGMHNTLMLGPPGAGKSLLASRVPRILPKLSPEEQREVLQIHGGEGSDMDSVLRGVRPFRAPHHSCSEVALVGGGRVPSPGEASLSHQGVLFLDELPEFRRGALEALRTPLESGVIHVARASGKRSFPASFLLLAAMNPCPCGFNGAPGRRCRCSVAEVRKYIARLSAPFLDRIDLQIELVPVSAEQLFRERQKEPQELRDSIAQIPALREQQIKRQGCLNSKLSLKRIVEAGLVSAEATRLLTKVANQMRLSSRSSVRVLRVARTIADLGGKATILEEHVREAQTLRQLDRVWGQFEADSYARENSTPPSVG